MMAWWQSLSARERGLVSIGTLAVLATLIFLLLLEPLQAKRARLAAQVAFEAQSLEDLRALSEEALALRADQQVTGALPTGQSLLAVLNSTAQHEGIQNKIARVVPNGDAEASVTFDGVAFDTLVTWLVTLRAQLGIQITRLVVDKTAIAGEVDASLTLATGS